MRNRLILLSLLLAAGAAAETTIGNYLLSANSQGTRYPVPSTVVDTGSWAKTAGNIGAVVVRIGQLQCTGDAFKVKFFRRSLNDLSLIAERGPFPATNVLTKVAITPPVAVGVGDLIGITELKPCMQTMGMSPVAGRSAYRFAGDVTDVNVNVGAFMPGMAIAVYGAESMESEVRTHVVLAAGAAPGAGGSQFKTDLYVGNLGYNGSRGRLVYHPAGAAGSAADPSFAYNVEPQRSITLPDFVGRSLGRAGIGSIDVYTTIGFDAPYVAARIYDDAGATGTKGFTLEGLPPESALLQFENAILFTPTDAARFRMNLGVRTLEATEVQFLHVDGNGVQRGFAAKSYPADYFIQGLVREFTGVTPQPNDTIIVYTNQKPVFVYGSIIDNASNDPSVQVAKQVK